MSIKMRDVNAKIEDYEFRADGAIVRKDRWEMGIRSIFNIVTDGYVDFEINDIVEIVRDLKKLKDSQEKGH